MAGEIIFYQSDDGAIRLETQLENETLWLTQQQMAELFQTTQQNISLHVKNIYTEGELLAEVTHKKNLWVRHEGNRQVQRELDSYNLDMVISVGYRVKSLIATRFRIWATRRVSSLMEPLSIGLRHEVGFAGMGCFLHNSQKTMPKPLLMLTPLSGRCLT